MKEKTFYYNLLRQVPETAKKEIKGGRLKGMTDINPMFRIKALTEAFGTCGFGWKYEIVRTWIETSMAKDEITANVQINLYVKDEDTWSEPIPGIGGSMLVASERNGLYVNDECYKMALTDAISVACKALGMGADVYWDSDNTKYNDRKREQPKEDDPMKKYTDAFNDRCKSLGVDRRNVLLRAGWKSGDPMTKSLYEKCMTILDEVEATA